MTDMNRYAAKLINIINHTICILLIGIWMMKNIKMFLVLLFLSALEKALQNNLETFKFYQKISNKKCWLE